MSEADLHATGLDSAAGSTGSSTANALAPRLQTVGNEDPINLWQYDDSLPDFQSRTIAARYTLEGSPENVPRSKAAKSDSDAATMALTLKSLPISDSLTSERTPSLDHSDSNYTLASSSRLESVSTSRGWWIAKPGPLLEDGTLPDLPSQQHVRCSFHFLNCQDRLTDVQEWLTHCKSHFRGEEPAKRLDCPFSCAWYGCESSGAQAWEEWSKHCTSKHRPFEESIDLTKRPSLELIRRLESVGAIDVSQVKELRRNGRLGADARPYASMNDTSADRRRGRPRDSH